MEYPRVLTNKKFEDIRGAFFETFNECIDLDLPEFVQDNLSYSGPSVLRGMHIQRENPQGKLVRCIKGTILDVIVDLRPGSTDFKKVSYFVLNRPEMAVWVPPGFAHGYYSYDNSIVYYKCSQVYHRESDGGINPLDPDLNFHWPSSSVIISNKDKNLPTMREWLDGKRNR